MKYTCVAGLIALTLCFEVGAHGTEMKMNQIRTYLSWSQPIDPAKIITIVDMDLSYALAATLVEWDSNKQFRKGLAEKWELIGNRTYRFTLRSGQKWSDGSKITCMQVKASFERGMKEHPDDLRSLINILEKIECKNDSIDFILKSPSSATALLGKLTEPNYGISKVEGGRIDLSSSTGPFFIASSSSTETVLKRNPFWFHTAPDMASEVIIKKPSKGYDSQTALSTDSWPNLVETSSLMKGDILTGYKKQGYRIWERPIDKVFLIRMSKRLENASGFQLFRFLRKTLNKNTILTGLSGYSLGDQIFPKGYQLYDPNFPIDSKSESLPEVFKGRPLEVMFCRARVSTELQKNISRALTDATGSTPKFVEIDVSEQATKLKEGNFDIYIGTMGLADPDPEGVMSYYIDNNPSVIPKSDGKFVHRLDQARKESDPKKRIAEFQKILTDATVQGYVIPLFHLSTIGLGRPELDFSLISPSEESVTLSKVRFKGSK